MQAAVSGTLLTKTNDSSEEDDNNLLSSLAGGSSTHETSVKMEKYISSHDSGEAKKRTAERKNSKNSLFSDSTSRPNVKVSGGNKLHPNKKARHK